MTAKKPGVGMPEHIAKGLNQINRLDSRLALKYLELLSKGDLIGLAELIQKFSNDGMLQATKEMVSQNVKTGPFDFKGKLTELKSNFSKVDELIERWYMNLVIDVTKDTEHAAGRVYRAKEDSMTTEALMSYAKGAGVFQEFSMDKALTAAQVLSKSVTAKGTGIYILISDVRTTDGKKCRLLLRPKPGSKPELDINSVEGNQSELTYAWDKGTGILGKLLF